ncbi:MAG: IS1595 family transposase [Novosphingobium sp.]
MSALSRPEFHSEEAAFNHLEKILWAGMPVCPHCGGVERITKVKANPEKRIRVGLWRCGDCKKQFTVKVGTVFEHMRLPLHKALQAVYLITSSKKGISAHQLHRILEITYKSAWFLCHRIREAMRDDHVGLLGSNGGAVEVDETFIGHLKGRERKRAFHHKMKVLALVDRETGMARTMVIDGTTARHIMPIVKANVSREATLMTDEHWGYRPAREHFAAHRTTPHGAGIYVDPTDRAVHSNTVEGYFSIFKRGMKGVFQHCGEQHLHRYLAEFEFRYNHRVALGFNDPDRSRQALHGIVGKRLTYARPDLQPEA